MQSPELDGRLLSLALPFSPRLVSGSVGMLVHSLQESRDRLGWLGNVGRDLVMNVSSGVTGGEFLRRTAILSVVAYVSRSIRGDMEGSPVPLTKFVKSKGASKLKGKRIKVPEVVESTIHKGEVSYTFGQCPRMLSRMKNHNLFEDEVEQAAAANSVKLSYALQSSML
jgi:hypothetical protein